MALAVLTSGGDAPGMNAALRAVVRSALAAGIPIHGVRHGYAGLFAEAIAPLRSEDVANILQRGGSILGAGRAPRFLDPAARREAAAVLRRRGIEGLVVIGGDGSYRGALALHRETGIGVIGVPGSIDNDVGGTDRSIGFETAVQTALTAIDRIRDTAFSHDRLFFVEVMGRHSGWIAAAVGLAGGAEAILVPETPTDLDALAARINAAARRGKLASIVVVAEGDEAGGAAEIAAQLRPRLDHEAESRVVILGHIQRGGAPTAADRILATRLGAAAIDAWLDGERAVAVGVYAGEVVRTPLADAVAQRPTPPASWFTLADRLAGGVRGSEG